MIVDVNDPITWNLKDPVGDSYWMTYKFGKPISYCRAGFYNSYRSFARKFGDALSLEKGQRVALIGAGYGWTAEWLEEDYGVSVIATEISEYLHQHKDDSDYIHLKTCGLTDEQIAQISDGGPNARHELLKSNILTEEGREDIGKCDWVLDENILPWLTDSEAIALDNAMRQVGPTAHLVTPDLRTSDTPPELPPVWNWKKISDWKNLLPNSTIISTYDGTVM